MIIKWFSIGLSLAILGLCSVVIFNQILLFTFLLVDYNLKTLHEPKDYPAVSTSFYAKSFWKEVFYALGKYYYYPLKYLDLTTKAKLPSDTAILLVHGYCRNKVDWLWLRKQLQQTNCHIFTINLMPMLSSIEEICAQSLPKKITQIKQQTNCKHIILIGHSMGGLVSSYYKQFLDKDKVVSAVITIGSPYYGTKVSVVASGINARQMCPGSDFLMQLRDKIQSNPQNHYEIISKFDNVVFPWNSAVLESIPITHQFILPFTTHLGLLHSKEVATQLNLWVAEIKQKAL